MAVMKDKMHRVYPKKRFGQNFLKDKNIARKIVKAIDAPHPQLIVEIGPGTGVLTEFVLNEAENYVGIEIDRSLFELLQNRFSGLNNFSLVSQDFLEFDLAEVFGEFPDHSKVILGNIPYNITSPILFKLFDQADSLNQAVLMVQKEVGNRIRAMPGGKDYGLLSIFSQIFADVNSLFSVPAKLFFPQPKVDSAVIKFQFRRGAKDEFADFELFRKMVRTCFQHRRKMLRNSLSQLFSVDVLTKLGTSLSQRPEQLSINQWKEIFQQIHQTIEKKDTQK
jgi:16S rRNA (adenine1518-N6/adenine1519-N6)-dimethyltransferase